MKFYIKLFFILLLLGLNGPVSFAKMTEKDLLAALEEAADFTLPYSARPTKTSSREEAFEALTAHCWAMHEYHQDMASFYKEKQKQYSSSTQSSYAKKALSLFLKNLLGFDLPKQTDPEQYICSLSVAYEKHSDVWKKKWTGLTGKEATLSDGTRGTASCVLLPDNTTSKAITARLEKDCEELKAPLEELKKNLSKYLKSKQLLLPLDELWALRYAHALILPWTKPDAEIAAEKKAAKIAAEKKAAKIAEKKRLKNQKKNQKKIAKKEKLKKAQDELSLSDLNVAKTLKEDVNVSSSSSSYILPEEEPKQPLPSPKPSDNLPLQEQPSQSDNARAKQEELDEEPSYQAYIEEGKEKSRQKLIQKTLPVKESGGSNSVTPPQHKIDKESYATFINLFENQKVTFESFTKAFNRGLGGQVYKDKGGSYRTFQIGKYSFLLHKPHGHDKGRAIFYEELRHRALKHLERLGITQKTIAIAGK